MRITAVSVGPTQLSLMVGSTRISAISTRAQPSLSLSSPLSRSASLSDLGPLVTKDPSAHPQFALRIRLAEPQDLQLPDTSGVVFPMSLPPAFKTRTPPRPIGSTRHPTSSAMIPRPSCSALVSRRPASNSGLYYSGDPSSLRPIGSVGILLPSDVTSVALAPHRPPDPRLCLSHLNL